MNINLKGDRIGILIRVKRKGKRSDSVHLKIKQKQRQHKDAIKQECGPTKDGQLGSLLRIENKAWVSCTKMYIFTLLFMQCII